MVSLQIPFLQLNHHQTNTILDSEGNSNSKKRKWDHHTDTHDILLSNNHWMSSTPKTLAATTTTTATNSFFDVNLHLETPLPSEWQRCLDIQSGEIHFYNTRTKKRTMRDPRKSEEPSSPRNHDHDHHHDHHMSLDLQLNLPCGSLNQKTSPKNSQQQTTTPKLNKCSSSPPPRASTNSLLKCLTSKTVDNTGKDDEGEEAVVEMVAVACMRCHMLVMLQKSSPTCPNCKFIHPPYQNTTVAATTTVELFNPKLSLFC